jgi:tripartite-type tricarboxylate transporter receptor subunit TctC
MKPKLFATLSAASFLASAALLSTAAYAQSYPSKAVRMIVPFAPGGGTDIQARLLSKKFQESTSQTFIVDNRPTANGMLGAELAAKSPPDGYTILFPLWLRSIADSTPITGTACSSLRARQRTSLPG